MITFLHQPRQRKQNCQLKACTTNSQWVIRNLNVSHRPDSHILRIAHMTQKKHLLMSEASMYLPVRRDINTILAGLNDPRDHIHVTHRTGHLVNHWATTAPFIHQELQHKMHRYQHKWTYVTTTCHVSLWTSSCSSQYMRIFRSLSCALDIAVIHDLLIVFNKQPYYLQNKILE